MICLQNDPQGAGILMDYCAGTLDAASSAQLEAHFRNCAACSQAAEAQRKVWKALDEWTPEEVSSDFDAGDFDRRLYARIAVERREPWWRPSLRKPLVPAIAVAAMLILALLPHSPHVGVPPPSPTPQVVAGQKIDLPQVEQALDDMDMLTPVGQSSSSRL
jgi:anti-sigma factor RsiW